MTTPSCWKKWRVTLSKIQQKLSYYCIRACTYPIGFLPLSWIRFLGKGLGLLLFHTMKKYRKKTLSNIALAKDLSLSPQQVRAMAKKSMQNLAITALEYPKFSRTKRLEKYLTCQNPQSAQELAKQNIGIVFFCGHQANWETLFLDGTLRMKGAAIAKTTKNPFLYKWIVSIRERNGGAIIEQKRALKEGLSLLKKGVFLGILGDQADPESAFSFPFFSRSTKISLAPAILSYRSKGPMMVATVKRSSKGYKIRYSDPIWPDQQKPLKQEVKRMMQQAWKHLETSIAKAPEEWLWQHNQYKQQNKKTVKPEFRHEAIFCIFHESTKDIYAHLSTLRKIYPDNFFFVAIPTSWEKPSADLGIEEVFSYQSEKDLLVEDYRFKFVLNFSPFSKIKRHFLRLSAFEVLSFEDILAITNLPKNACLKNVFIKAFCKQPIDW